MTTTATAAKPVKGLTLHVFRDTALSDCTNGGITARAQRVTLVGLCDFEFGGEPTRLPEWQLTPPSEDAPAVVAVVLDHFGGERNAFLVPVEIRDNELQRPHLYRLSHGGNFAGVSDSRFGSTLYRYLGYRPDVLRVHDRTE
ncbi:hypothetical protein [Nocardia veterana]|uniref:Uncharacterized protein n=1 Tax=Nocardia veterana TaxID=132249 RepID=A0A7X6RLK7_9NOCA|nr:hypothetical protein [Nocardia veterana]NKY89873.1 hypothetical protein [Nocardia veterana]